MSADKDYPPIDFSKVKAVTVASGDTFEGFLEAVALAGRNHSSEVEATKAAVQRDKLNARFTSDA